MERGKSFSHFQITKHRDYLKDNLIYVLTGYITIIITGFHAMLLTRDVLGLNNTKNRQVVFYYYLMALE